MFSFSIIPYAGFLYHLTRSKKAPPLALFGFYFLLAFVFGTIPAGIIGGLQVDGCSDSGSALAYGNSVHNAAVCVHPNCWPSPHAAKTRYGTTLANVDFLHGPAESLLTITNLLIGKAVDDTRLKCIVLHLQPCLPGGQVQRVVTWSPAPAVLGFRRAIIQAEQAEAAGKTETDTSSPAKPSATAGSRDATREA
jgi:Protein of unknown function (DUF3593)